MKLGVICLWIGSLCAATAWAQTTERPFDRRNSFTIFAEYANDSSHIVAGQARQRKLATLGGAYTLRVAHIGGTEIGYRVEVRPVIFESDPVHVISETVTSSAPQPATYSFTSTDPVVPVCRPYTQTFVGTPPVSSTETTVATCGRQWTFGQELAPLGLQYTTAVRHPVQPYLLGALGYMYTSRPVPVSTAEAFNFVIDVGAGVQVYRRARRSVALEARVRHLSNRDTAQSNPGVDAVTYGVAYSFGR